MAYWKDTWKFRESIEYEFKYAGKYGAKGEKRGKRKKASPEQIRKQNQRNRSKRIRRVIKANFDEGDLWCTLKYPAGTKKTLDEVKKDWANFRTAVTRAYRTRGHPFKWICRMEIGARGGIHIHLLVNRLPGEDTDLLLQSKWQHGRINYQSIYEQGGYDSLAAYIVKEPDEEVEGQMSLFAKEEQKELIKYSSSRNLIRPEPIRKEYKHWNMRKLIKDGPRPSPGYYIEENSIECGVNQYTGMSYFRYTEIRIKEVKPDAENRHIHRQRP